MVRSQVPRTEIDIVVADLSSEFALAAAFREIEGLLGEMPVECVLYNAAKVGPSELVQFPVQDFKQALHVSPDSAPVP